MASMQEVFAAYDARTSELKKSSNPFAKGVAWIQGELVPLHEARIPLLDQGFMHSGMLSHIHRSPHTTIIIILLLMFTMLFLLQI